VSNKLELFHVLLATLHVTESDFFVSVS
jgi:hypothetical protein